jgi:LAO/AO transport system kinase
MSHRLQDMPQSLILEELAKGNKRTLAKTITLLESHKESDRALALHLLKSMSSSLSDNDKLCPILGITGTPGVGKSSFIERLGLLLVKEHHLKIAVLAIDPSSPVSGGSLLGDKTRMEELSREENVFIRPSPGGQHPGGIGQYASEVLTLFSYCPFDFIIVESIGAGQSEFDLNFLVDRLLVLMQPASGDDLQALKKGVLELADYIVINKADGPQLKLAERSLAQLHVVQQLGQKHLWRQEKPQAFMLSAKTGFRFELFIETLIDELITIDKLKHVHLKELRSTKLSYYYDVKLKERILQKVLLNSKYEKNKSESLKKLKDNYHLFFQLIHEDVDKIYSSISKR